MFYVHPGVVDNNKVAGADGFLVPQDTARQKILNNVFNSKGGAPYQLINGTVIASNMTDLLNGTLAAPILIDESGNTKVGSFEVWTATAADGTNPGAGACLNWTTGDVGERGLIGRADAVDATWSDVAFEDICDTFNRLYCFADDNSN